MAREVDPPSVVRTGCDAPGYEADGLCGRDVYARGKCQSHYLFMRKHPGEPLRALAPRRAYGSAGGIRRYGLRWSDEELLQQVENYAAAHKLSGEAAIEELLRDRMADLATGKAKKP